MPRALRDLVLREELRGREESIAPLAPDAYERPAQYRSRVWPFSALAALRYLTLKRASVGESWALRRWPPDPERVRQGILDALGEATPGPWDRLWLWLLRPLRLGGICAVMLVAALTWSALDARRQAMEHALSVELPNYLDLAHGRKVLEENRRWMELHGEGPIPLGDLTYWLQGAEQAEQVLRVALLRSLPDDPELQRRLAESFEAAASQARSEVVVRDFSSVNERLEEIGMDYFVQPHTFDAPCLSFLALTLEDKLYLAQDEDERDRYCRTTMAATYRVAERKTYELDGARYDVQILSRLDRTSLAESYLGVTYEHGADSQIYRERIVWYALDAVFAGLTTRGRHAFIPLGVELNATMQHQVGRALEHMLHGFYGEDLGRLERVAARLAARKEYVDEARLRQSLLRASDHVTPSPSSGNLDIDGLSSFLTNLVAEVDPGRLAERRVQVELRADVRRLAEAIEDAVAIHEVVHQRQLRNREDLPAWPEAIWSTTHDPEERARVIMEVEAYLASMAQAGGTRALTVTQLYLFTLDTNGPTEPEQLAGGIVLQAMFDGDLAALDPTAAFAALGVLDDQDLGRRATTAYQRLFLRPAPRIAP